MPYLGPGAVHAEVADRTAVPGVATGLAVTGAGGDVLFVEATSMDDGGDAGLTVTGQLGDVMKESAQIALSYVRSQAGDARHRSVGAEPKRFHVHFPAGAVPKDGPSAGITMTTALVSLLTGRPVRNEVGMTGEVTLSGRVLPIGGVKQKVLAAHRAGLTEVILPARNEPDLDDVPEEVRDEMTFHLVDNVDKVLDLALGPRSRNPGSLRRRLGSMRTPVCDLLGIEFPILAFSHCRDVVAAVSKAGGIGVLGAVAFTPGAARHRARLDREARSATGPTASTSSCPPKYVGVEEGGLDGAEARRR